MRITYSTTAYVPVSDAILDAIEATFNCWATGDGVLCIDLEDLKNGVEIEDWFKLHHLFSKNTSKSMRTYLRKVIKEIEEQKTIIDGVVFTNY